MSEGFAQSQQNSELAQLPATDPRRQAFEASLAKMEPAERQYWQAMLQETDRLYAQMADVAVPRDLEQRLRAIAEENPRASWWRQALQMRLNGPTAAFAALAAVVVVAVTGYLLWQPVPPLPPMARELDDQLARTVAARAINADGAAPLQVASSDAGAVAAALKAHSYTFPVVMLTPRAPLELRGGGECDLGGTPAVFTRWQGGGAHYTLFEFDGKALGMPANFFRNTQAPKDLWHDDSHYRVVLWPGANAACTWALVMDTDAATDLFSGGY
jgi:hypothetical protein